MLFYHFYCFCILIVFYSQGLGGDTMDGVKLNEARFDAVCIVSLIFQNGIFVTHAFKVGEAGC